MDKQDPIKRTLITTALAFTLSILSWYIQTAQTEERQVNRSEQAKETSNEERSRVSIRN